MSLIKDLTARGQAVWLDFVDRKFLAEGGLQKLIDEDGLTGVTSNPSIFEKAMGHGTAYDAALAEFDREHPGAPAMDRYEHLAIRTSRRPPIRCARSMTGSAARTAMSASKSRPISPTIPTARSPKPRSCGGWSTGPI